MYSVSAPCTQEEFDNYFLLRWEVLRKPWNKPPGSERDEMEKQCLHAWIRNSEQEVLAVCRLQMNDEQTAQLRYMAVRPDMQGKGLGRLLLDYMQEQALQKGAGNIVLHARDNAVAFYRSCGYEVVETSYLMWDLIQHYLMKKYIP